MNLNESIEKAAKFIHEANAVLITTGAGIGVDSGLPDFRGNEGFWKAYPPMARLGISFVEMANPHWFQQDPHLAWGFYGHRLNLYRRTEPHDGFKILLEIANQKEHGYFVFTSNVDGQFPKAGFDENRIEECHGSIHHFQCTNQCTNEVWDASDITVTVDDDTTMEEVAMMLRDLGCTGVPVVDKDEQIAGIVSRRDFKKIRKSKQMQSPVKAFMSRNIVTISHDRSAIEAARLMIKHDVGRIPVMQDNKIIGIITRSDAMMYFYDLLPD